ncbi:MAG: DNA topoisomerase III, partial [Lachnospirales bacterium]
KDNKFFKAIKKDLTLKMVIELLEKGSTKLTGCHSAKTGKKFNCILKFDDSYSKYASFKMEFESKKK